MDSLVSHEYKLLTMVCGAQSGPFDTPETLSNVYSLAAPFITSCPSTNPALPVVAFPKSALMFKLDVFSPP